MSKTITVIAGNYDGRRRQIISTWSLDTLDEAFLQMSHECSKYDFINIKLRENDKSFTIDKYHHIFYSPDVAYEGIDRRQVSGGVDRRRADCRNPRHAFMSDQSQGGNVDLCQLFRERRAQAGKGH